MLNASKLCGMGGVILVASVLALVLWEASGVGRSLRSLVRMGHASGGVDFSWQGYLNTEEGATRVRAVGEGEARAMLGARESAGDGSDAPALYRVTLWIVSSSEGWWAPVWRTYTGELRMEEAWLSTAPDAGVAAALRDAAIAEAASEAAWLQTERIGKALRRAPVGSDGRVSADVRTINVAGVVHDAMTITGVALIAIGIVLRRRERNASSVAQSGS